MTAIQHIIFDLDGLIVDTEPLHQRAINTLLQLVGADYQFSLQEYGQVLTGRAVFENAEYLRERFALPQTAAQLTEAHRALFTVLIADASNLEPMPGLAPLLDALAASGLRLAIASSTRPEQVQLILRGLNLHEHFDAVVGNDGSLKPKPAPDVYLLALQQLGAKAETTLALEDSGSGVRAAQTAGLFVIAVPNAFTRNQDLSAANLIMENLDQVREFLIQSPTLRLDSKLGYGTDS